VVEDIAFVIGNCRPPVPTALRGRTPFIAQAICHAVTGLLHESIAGEPNEVIPVPTCHSTSLMPAGRLLAGGMGFTGPVRYVA